MSNTLGKAIKDARWRRGMNIATLSSLLSVSELLVLKIENNVVDVKLPRYNSLIPKIAQIFGLNETQLEKTRQQTDTSYIDLSTLPLYYDGRFYTLEQLRKLQ